MAEVTVLIPCYNAAQYVGEAIASVLAQGGVDIDVLVVNDGSTDDSERVAASFGGAVTVLNQENRGVSAARNAGIASCKSPLIMLLDADDRLKPECVQSRVRLLTDRPDCGFLLGSYSEMTPTGELRDRKHRGHSAESVGLLEMLGGRYCVGQSGMLVRKSTFDRVGGFDPILAACEDWDWQVRAAAVTKAVFDPEPRVIYRQVSGSASRNTLRMVDGVEIVIQKNRIFAEGKASYALASISGRFNTLGSMIFHRTLSEGGSLMRLLIERPRLIPYCAAWLGRAAINRAGRLMRA